MSFSSWDVRFDRAIIGTAVHAGHELRPEIALRMVLDEAERLREEDPHTDLLAASVGSHVAVHRSRFEVDLNRDRDAAVYRDSSESWGIEVWDRPLDADVVDRSLALHVGFYARLGDTLDELVRRHGGFVLYDVHSYNHRRNGPDQPPEDPAGNPVVNLGTGSLPDRWEPVAAAFVDSMSRSLLGGEAIDVRRDVKFRGREVARFVHDRYGEVGCALAIEFKKVFMDEWTAAIDRPSLDKPSLDDLARALGESLTPVREAWESTQMFSRRVEMAVTEGDLAIDKELSEISGLLPLLRYVTPINAAETCVAFGDGVDPVFEYLPIPDLTDTARRLSAVDPDRATDPTVRHMARALKRELGIRLDLLSVRETPRFFLAAVELFGHVEAPLLELALDLLRAGAVDGPIETISAHEFAVLARREIDHYREDFPEMSTEVFVRDRIAGVMVENGNLYVGSGVRIAADHVPQLLHHEVGVHVLTYVNGSAQPLHMLAVGLAGHDENQEALGVLSEHLSGGLPRSRLHTLASRVVAAQLRSDDASFRETHDRLVELGATSASAFATTMRAYRSGGMTKDAVYLRGLVRLCGHLANGGTLERLFIGKVALEDEPLITELREREVLSEPPLRPRFLGTPVARRRLDEIRAGHDVRHIGGIAA